MKHRDLPISLLGIVAGLILGAGSILSVQGEHLSAATQTPRSALRAVPEVSRRSISNKSPGLIRSDDAITRYPTVKTSTSSSSAALAEEPTTDGCRAVRSAVAKIRDTYNAVIALNVKNTAIRMRFDATFAEVLHAECPETAAASSAASVAPATVMMDNNCEKYPAHSLRYSQCVLSEQNGKTYP